MSMAFLGTISPSTLHIYLSLPRSMFPSPLATHSLSSLPCPPPSTIPYSVPHHRNPSSLPEFILNPPSLAAFHFSFHLPSYVLLNY